MSVAEVPAYAAPLAKPNAVEPSAVPVLGSAELKAPENAPAKPKADFAPLMSKEQRSSFDPQKSKVVSRSTFVDEYENPDGTRTIKQSTEPRNVKDGLGNWQAVDTTLVADTPTRRVKAKQHPLKPTLGATADDPSLVTVEFDGHRVTLAPEKPARDRKVKIADTTAEYADVAPDTDLTYEVTPGSVKETIKLKKVPSTNKWRFTLKTGNLTPAVTEQGTVELRDAQGTPKIVMPPIVTWDSTGNADAPPAQTGGTYALEKSGGDWVLTVAVDDAWLKDPKRVYPVSVDPTFTYGVAYAESYKSDGYWCGNCGVQFGNALDRGDKYWRSAIRFNYENLYGQRIVGAKLDLTNQRSPLSPDKTWQANLYHASAMDFNGLGGHLASGLVGQVGTLQGPSLVSFLQHIADIRHMASFMVTGHEASGVWTYKLANATLTVDTGSAPPAPTLSGPADHSVIINTTPTLAVNPVSDPDGEPVKYCFTVATGTDAKSGVVVDSGCLDTPSWTVPAGVLDDGVAYTWQAKAVSGATSVIPSNVFHLKVDQRIGDRGPAPGDVAGPFSVNAANGNLSTSLEGPTFNTVGGQAGLKLTYNSQQQERKGLRASYFPDLSHNGEISPQQEPVLVRTEPQVNVDWGDTSPFAPALPKDWFVARWEGYFQAPETGTYQFAGAHDDRLRVWVNGNSVYDQGCCSDVNWGVAGSVSLTAGQRVPIKIELAEVSGAAYLRLFTRTTEGNVTPQVVPADWLRSSDLPVLPKGWTLSADLDGAGRTFTEAKVTDQNVVLTDGTGAKFTWTKKSTGGYTPPDGEEGVLALDTAGRITLTYGSEVFAFNSQGKLESQSGAIDSRKPATLQNVYDGAPSRLKEIKDPVSGRSHRLHYNRQGDDCYGGVTPPSHADALPPAQMLCRIVYWDGSQTKLFYSRGQLARVEDPGQEITDLGFNVHGLLDNMRDSRAVDWVSADCAARCPSDHPNWMIHYWDVTATKPLVRQVIEPKPFADVERGHRGYRYDPTQRTSYVDRGGVDPASGFYRKFVYDDALRLLSTTDATGKVTSQTWNVKDLQLSSTDAAGRTSTTVYDAQDRPIENYGPAPSTCYNGQFPKPECAATVPVQKTGYDEGVNGLAVSFYDNRELSGAPKVHQTGLAADGTLVRNWGTDNPVAGITSDWFSLRASGDVVFPEAGNYKLRVLADDGVRVYVDDVNVIDDWIDSQAKWREATVSSPSAGAVKRIRIDYYDQASTAQLELHWTTPGGTQQVVPATSLKPKYALTTSKRKFLSHGYGDIVETHKFGENGLDASYGQVTSSTVNGLQTKFSYETPGSGYLRKTGRTAANGAQTTYQHYGDTEMRDNPCTPEADAVNQGGMPKLTKMQASADGTAREDERVLDASGRTIAEGGAGKWICTRYDARDRTVEVKFPGNAAQGERVVTTNHAVNGDPLVSSVTDHNGTVTTKVDLLGRNVEYTDVHGVRTETKYDRSGRATTEKVNLPLNTAQTVTYTHDDNDRVSSVSLDGALLATPVYDAAGELKSVTYANGTALSAIDKDGAGDVTSIKWKTKAGTEIASTVTRIRGGRIIDETLGGYDASPGGANYVYDPAGRLIEAIVRGHHFRYDFVTNTTGCPAGSVGNAAQSGNRLKLLDITSSGTAETGYCYDSADRLLATTGVNATTNIKYDTKGNTTEYTVNGSTTHLTWDGADRNIGARSVGADPAAVAYQRDSTNRIVRRSAEQGDQQAVALYAHTADGDSADIVLGENKKLLSRSISLPGGVLLTISGDARRYDHPTVRGDLTFTTDSAGNQVGQLRHYTPFGDPIADDGAVNPDAVPDNQPGHLDFGWLGQHQKQLEHAGALSLVQMGARPYSPLLGRFLSVDPIEGGSANDYDYVNGDPVNVTDLDGKCPPCLFLAVAGLRVGGPILARLAVRAAVKVVPRALAAVKSGYTRAATWLAPRIYSARVKIHHVRVTVKPALGRCVRGGITAYLGASKSFAVVTNSSLYARLGAAAVGCAGAVRGRWGW